MFTARTQFLKLSSVGRGNTWCRWATNWRATTRDRLTFARWCSHRKTLVIPLSDAAESLLSVIKSFSKLLLLCAGLASTAAAQSPTPSRTDLARWSREAASVTITRDDWGIPHISGKTDADAVFGLLYAQAEDDFNRVETNYFNALGRAAESEGEGAIYRDLRMRLINNPDSLKALYSRSPRWLRSVMNAYADGLNYYLYKHPEVKPKVIANFEPWMPLAFSDGSIGPDIESVNLTQLAAFYGGRS